MKKSALFLLTTVLSFYSNISLSATTEWLQANLISDVGGDPKSANYLFTLSPQLRTMEWGISSSGCAQRYIGYFIMIRHSSTDNDGPWLFLNNAYRTAYKSMNSMCTSTSIQNFPDTIKALKSTAYVSSPAIHGVFASYCVGFGYSSYTGQNSSSRDGRPKRVDGTDINFNDPDLSCGRYIYNYIPCKAQVSSLDLDFGNVDLTSLNTAKATASLKMDCVFVFDVVPNGSPFAIRLNNGDGIVLNNGTKASIYIDDKKITSANNSRENFIFYNGHNSYNLMVSATLSGTPTKMGDFKGSGYLVMEYF